MTGVPILAPSSKKEKWQLNVKTENRKQKISPSRKFLSVTYHAAQRVPMSDDYKWAHMNNAQKCKNFQNVLWSDDFKFQYNYNQTRKFFNTAILQKNQNLQNSGYDWDVPELNKTLKNTHSG